MDGSRDYNANRDESVRKRQIPYDFTHMWNLRKKTNKQREKKEREKNKPGNTHLSMENTDSYQRGGKEGWVKMLWGLRTHL